MLMTIIYFLAALTILVGVHEYGHFQIARWCGVKVLRFSIGFGKIVFQRSDKKGTLYALSAIPLGGYVKMLDEREGPVLAKERHLAFNNKSVWARIAIVLAGPLFNFFFAILCFWLIFLIGMKSLVPIIAEVKPNSEAYSAGLLPNHQITAINAEPVHSWQSVQYQFMPFIDTDNKVAIEMTSLTTAAKKTVYLSLKSIHLNDKKQDLLKTLGLKPFIPAIPPVVGEVMDSTPASKAGLKARDIIIAIDNTPVNDWLSLVKYVRKHPNQSILLSLKREGKPLTLSLLTGAQEGKGFLGVRTLQSDWPAQWVYNERPSPWVAFKMASLQTLQLTKLTFSMMGRLVTGQLNMNTLSGPVGIAKEAGLSARKGFSDYLFFLALISISLGALNLLPIPLLDGGHLLYFFIEIITRKPVSLRVQTMGFYLGVIFIFTLMFVALYNDIFKLMNT